ncbi:MAG: hypothetical protein AB7F75_00430 [Planctomycetota bacterium]
MKRPIWALAILTGIISLTLHAEEDPWGNPVPQQENPEPQKQNPQNEIQALQQALLNPDGLAQLLGKPLLEAKSEHFRIISMLSDSDNRAILEHTEKAVAELGKILQDPDIFATVPDKLVFLILDSREAYETYVKTMVKAQVSDEVNAGLLLRAAGFAIPTQSEIFKINQLHPQAPRVHNCGFVAHGAVTHFLEAWKNPGKGSKPLPAWFRVGAVLLVDMKISGNGGYYEIAYGKADSKDEYRDVSKREDWLRLYKDAKEPLSLEKVINTSFAAFTHECRAISWMACETLLESKKKGIMAELTEKFRTAGDYETCLTEVTGWNYKKFSSRMADWVNSQKIAKEKK